MNYLVIEGYKDAAEKFSMEAGISTNVDLSSIQDRMDIRNAIQDGNIEEAIEKVNDLDPEILDTNPKIYFHLQQQRLIELIRENKIAEALEFAQEELAPRGEENVRDLKYNYLARVFGGIGENYGTLGFWIKWKKSSWLFIRASSTTENSK
jgi:hypothetical protein